MIIICPKCNLNYQIKGDLISENGRKVKCFSCESFWIQYPNGKIKELKIEKDFSTELQKRQNFISARAIKAPAFLKIFKFFIP